MSNLIDEIELPLTEESQKMGNEPDTVERRFHNILRKSSNNGCGKFQWIIFLTVFMGMNGFSWYEYGLGFYELFPEFNCTIEGVETENCSVNQICQG